VIPFVFDIINSVHSLPMIVPTDFTDKLYSVGINDTSLFFLLCFNYYFSHCNFLSIYRGNMSVGKINRKFTNKNIPSVFLFIFINFLIVKIDAIYIEDKN
jgi:hypothetical protein